MLRISTPMQASDVVLKFLRGSGRTEEANYYLAVFRSEAPEAFAIIALDQAIREEALDAVAVDLRYLRLLGLTPVVLLGLDCNDGADGHAEDLQAMLTDSETAAVILPAADGPAAARTAARAGTLPLVWLRGPDQAARFEQLGDYVRALGTAKLIMLDLAGGLVVQGEPVSVANMHDDFTRLMVSPDVNEDQREQLTQVQRLLFELVAQPLVVTLTTPFELLRELFTVKGAGTLLRRGASVRRETSLAALDRAKVGELLLSSFGRTLRDGFFERTISRIYIADDYLGMGLVQETELGSYLSKYAVTRRAQGEGIGQDLWRALAADYPSLFWRSRANNPINAWYERMCTGRLALGEWTLYLRDIPTASIPAVAAYVLSQPDDFGEGP